MRGVRGLVVLGIALLLGLVAAKAVLVYLDGSKPQKAAQPVAAARHETPADDVAFTDSIPAGMRAVSIKVDEVTGVSRKVQKGDWVDVLATTSLPGAQDAGVARVVLERVRVMDVTGDKSERTQSKIKGNRDWIVTLLVTPEQGASLVAAASLAKISLLARHGGDSDPQSFREVAFSQEKGAVPLHRPENNMGDWIRPGMRAVTVAVQDTDGICGALRRGDRVDVIVTCPISKFASGGDVSAGAQGVVTEFAMRSVTLLQNVEVMANERSLEVSAGENQPVSRVTIQVTPQEAEKLAVVMDATGKSLLRLAARNSRDTERVGTPGQNLAELLTMKREYSRIEVYKGTKAQVKPFFH
ncbi:MAG: Flp pilus assembly protein CpaB [Deltaproteobacteria bacterium]|nr:Flp pilus assembly protein CpaB [Deltaproteobacteria bacterium]